MLAQAAVEPDWGGLPRDALEHIAKQLTFVVDYIRFAAVCKPWRSAAYENLRHRPRQLPFLLIRDPDGSTNARGIYSLVDKRLLNFRLPVPRAMRCRGSSDGWLSLIGFDLSITLFNPFSRKHIPLPPMNTIPNPFDDMLCGDTFIQKVILSSDPSFTPNFLVVITYSCRAKLAFFRPGDRIWNPIDCGLASFDDVLYHKGQFYAVNCKGMVVICDLTSQKPYAVELPVPLVQNSYLIKRYLVEWKGELLQIIREFIWEINDYDDEYRTASFEVYKLDLSGPMKWVEVTSLGNHIVFLGDNSSFSVSASDFPVSKRNCIYFTDDHFEQYEPTPQGFFDVGVYNFEDRSIELCYPIDNAEMPPPIWPSNIQNWLPEACSFKARKGSYEKGYCYSSAVYLAGQDSPKTVVYDLLLMVLDTFAKSRTIGTNRDFPEEPNPTFGRLRSPKASKEPKNSGIGIPSEVLELKAKY
ncbi:hypothetical protein ACLOJK_024479 [Asimina triloba]